MTSITLPPMDDATWARIGWHAQQQWLRAALAFRRQLIADVNARLAIEASWAANRRANDEAGNEMARARIILAGLPPDPKGPARLHALGEAIAHAEGLRTRRAS